MVHPVACHRFVTQMSFLGDSATPVFSRFPGDLGPEPVPSRAHRNTHLTSRMSTHHCEVVLVRSVEDASGNPCHLESNKECCDCGTNLCDLHAEECELCGEIFCGSCFVLHLTHSPVLSSAMRPERKPPSSEHERQDEGQLGSAVGESSSGRNLG